MLKIEDIIEIRRAKDRAGYEIVFPHNKIIWLVKRRTLAGLLLLIKHEYCSEADLVGANDRLKILKEDLKGKIDESWIQDRYGDANKPFSELWTEEGFSCIYPTSMRGNRQYVLKRENHDLLFTINEKSNRAQIDRELKDIILNTQNSRCNICGAKLKTNNDIDLHTFSKDRVKLEFDHRIPIDRGGKTELKNIQALCHYCNKCKRQMCFICKEKCSYKCALVKPEEYKIVLANNEDISDRITKKYYN